MKKHKIASLALAMAMSASFLVSNSELSRAGENKSAYKDEILNENEEYNRLKKELEIEKEKLNKLEAKKP